MMAIPTSPANIAGGADYKAGKADSVSGLKVIDPLTLQVTTTQPRHHAGQNWRACTVESPVRQRVSAGNLDYLRSLHGKPLGNGPYVYDKYIPGQEIRFHANSHFTVGRRQRRALSIA